ncbi:MAG: hypothetical protein E7623_04080 [Ruminococcaceae bacterium]|nr:hypothetical protein [Oscillospiraceae bacterium]
MRKNENNNAFKFFLTPFLVLDGNLNITVKNKASKVFFQKIKLTHNMCEYTDSEGKKALKRALDKGTAEEITIDDGLYKLAIAVGCNLTDGSKGVIVTAPKILQLRNEDGSRFCSGDFIQRLERKGVYKDFMQLIYGNLYELCKEDRYIELIAAEKLCMNVLRSTWNRDMESKDTLVPAIEYISEKTKSFCCKFYRFFDLSVEYGKLSGCEKIDLDMFSIVFTHMINFLSNITSDETAHMYVYSDINLGARIRFSCTCDGKKLSETDYSESFSNLAYAFPKYYLDLLIATSYASLFGYAPFFSVRKTDNTELSITIFLPTNKSGSTIENSKDLLTGGAQSQDIPSLAEQIFELVASEPTK